MEKLEADNGKEIYFDRDYDTTDYDIIDKKFKEERKHLDDAELELYIAEEFKKKDKLDDFVAAYMAETLVNRVKKVIDGQYAVIQKNINEPKPTEITRSELVYYIRDANQWIIDEIVDPKMFVQDADILCNIQTDCLFDISLKEGNCESTEMVKDKIINNALKDIMSQFDNKYNISKTELSEQIQKYLKYYENALTQMQLMRQTAFYKYNSIKYELGLKVAEQNLARVTSPYVKLRDLIVGQSDFIKKQNDIVLFVERYCRRGDPTLVDLNDGEMEHEWWMYCVETNSKEVNKFINYLTKYNFKIIHQNSKPNLEEMTNEGEEMEKLTNLRP
jgi:hypothetical protein